MRRLLSLVAPWGAVGLVAAWCAWPHPAWLVAAALSALGAAWSGPVRTRRSAAGLVLLLASVVVGLWANLRDASLARDFEAYWGARETDVFEVLSHELTGLVDRGIAATTTLAEQSADGNLPSHAEVASLRATQRLTALAVYDAEGRLLVWDGMHRGRVPESVQVGRQPYEFRELPLVSYLYFTARAPGGDVVAGASLLRSDLPSGEGGDADFLSPLQKRVGERIRILPADRVEAGDVFDYRWEDEVLFSVTVERPGEAARRDALLADVRRLLAGLVVAAWLLLALGTPGGRRRGRGAVAAAFALAALLPVGVLPGLAPLASPADFLLPGPVPLTLARAILWALAAVIAVGVARPGAWPGGRAVVATAGVALGLPALASGLGRATTSAFLAGPEAAWLSDVLTATAVFSLLAWLALVLARREGPRAVRVAVGLTTLIALSLVAGLVAARRPGLPAPFLALWALPVLILRPAGPRASGAGAFQAWMLALCLGASAALPWSWGQRTTARMAAAELDVERLGTGVDPFLQFLLERMSSTVDSLGAAGVGPVQLLYQGWRRSGLSAGGYPVWLTLWSTANVPLDELRIGFGVQDRPAVADLGLDSVRALGTPVVRRFETADAHYVAHVPLADGRIVSAVVPPLRAAGTSSFLGPLFASLAPAESDGLSLIPLLSRDLTDRGDSLQWVRADAGWQGEFVLTYPDQRYHARYLVALPGASVAVARAGLLWALSLLVGGVLWGLGRLMSDRTGRRAGWRILLPTSFRARVTLALFGFFLLSILIFGSLAYRTIAGASQRTAGVLSERVVDDAAGTYFEVQGEMHLLSRRVGADLLEYRGGELREGSLEELVELGLYEGWVPYEVYRSLAGREALLQLATTRLGDWEYVTAYRRVPDGDILGAPLPLQVGATAVRSREVAHLLGFAVVAGAALSFMLALLVGRTLTRPIQTLRVASERVGGGNLGVHLPGHRADEFGAVFEAFNRMVRRLRHARRDLVRTTRRTQAIVEDAATGVVALDVEGIVTLVNPMALDLLGMAIEVGKPLGEGTGTAAEFVRWVSLYFRDGLREASTEFQSGERRIRVRARRISHGGELAGAVVSLEDVTDELRTERILAWGEMARQVAHEVKNPLTPIKLSVQHIRRAWADRRTDFDAILTRNADAMLREIDRLASIAAGFSRFGAPGAAGQQPLAPVRLQDLVAEVMALYRSGEGPITFEARVPDSVPPVEARASEVKEVLVNLLENARAAIRDGGTVRVEGLDEGGDVALVVADDGVGIPAEMMPRIFEPHFSTRSTGTGLGLAIVRRLVEAWGASVSVESRVGEGTAVTIRLRPWGDAGDGGSASGRGGPTGPVQTI